MKNGRQAMSGRPLRAGRGGLAVYRDSALPTSAPAAKAEETGSGGIAAVLLDDDRRPISVLATRIVNPRALLVGVGTTLAGVVMGRCLVGLGKGTGNRKGGGRVDGSRAVFLKMFTLFRPSKWIQRGQCPCVGSDTSVEAMNAD